MGALLKLLGMQPQIPAQEALVQAPSADLIKSDNEFPFPVEPEEIQLEISPENIDRYTQWINASLISCHPVNRERLLHILKSLNFKVYNKALVEKFMGQLVVHLYKNDVLGDDLWWQWVSLSDYRHPLPTRVLDNVRKINLKSTSREIYYFVSDIVLVTGRDFKHDRNTSRFINDKKTIPMKRKTEVCFLKVAVDSCALPAEQIIIDAWRGPTFSDEESWLPGQKPEKEEKV